MANKKRTKEDYPIIKYRIVTGNGYNLFEGGEDELKKRLKEDFNFAKRVRDKRFEPQYVIKVTEEYLEISEFGIDGTE
jgi:hypothetical protein